MVDNGRRNSYSPPLLPVSRLPPEVLYEVFNVLRFESNYHRYSAAFDHYNGVCFSLLHNLTLVSRYWNVIASPLLWHSLDIRSAEELGRVAEVLKAGGKIKNTTRDYGYLVKNIRI